MNSRKMISLYETYNNQDLGNDTMHLNVLHAWKVPTTTKRFDINSYILFKFTSWHIYRVYIKSVHLGLPFHF